MTRAAHASHLATARHYRLIGWRGLAAEYLAKAAAERRSKSQSMQKEAA